MSTDLVQLLLEQPDVARVVAVDESVMLLHTPGNIYVLSNATECSLVDGKHWRHNGRRSVLVHGKVRLLKNYYVDDRQVLLVVANIFCKFK